jgi:hypothetical protein
VRQRLGARLGGRIAFSSGPRPQDVTAVLEQRADLLDAVGELTANLGMGLATLVATDERREPNADFRVRYVFEPARPSEAL